MGDNHLNSTEAQDDKVYELPGTGRLKKHTSPEMEKLPPSQQC